MKSLRLAALAAALVLGACSSATPTDPALLDSATPSFDGGNMLGSGNNSMEDGGGMIGSGNGTASTDSTGTTERGPGMMGSGN